MRRWRDQADARRGMPNPGDRRIDLVTGKLSAFARLGALRNLDLQLVGMDQIITGYAETARCDLLDPAVTRIAVRIRKIAFRVFTTLAGVALAADAIHGDGQRLVRFLADRTIRHRACLEALDYL